MWYAAHAVMLIRFKDGEQDQFPVWENIFLIQAENGEEAIRKAETRAREDESDDEGQTYDDRPSKFVFVGLRKLMQCFSDEEQPSDGTEVSHNQMTFQDKTSLESYLRGEEARVTFNDENPYQLDED